MPFTEARIAYELNGSVQVRDVATLLANGRLIGWLGDANGPVDETADSPVFAMLLQSA